MRHCVVKGTTTVIDGSLNSDEVMLQNASNMGFTVDQVEIITQEDYDARKVLEPQPIPQLSEVEELRDYLLDMEFRMIMKELEV